MNSSKYFRSEEFREDFLKQVEKNTWGNGLPKIYMDNDGNIIEHWKDGNIHILETKHKLGVGEEYKINKIYHGLGKYVGIQKYRPWGVDYYDVCHKFVSELPNDRIGAAEVKTVLIDRVIDGDKKY